MKHVWLGWVIVAWCVTSPAMAQTAQTVEEKENLVTKELKGFKFKVPADWPVEDRDGQVGPVPVEEYLAKKFSAVSARFDAVEKQLAALETRVGEVERRPTTPATLEQRINVVEQRVTAVEHGQNDQGRTVEDLKGKVNTLNERSARPVEGDLVPQQAEDTR